MSRNLNNIFIFTGNMAKDIEAKYTNEGLCVTSFVVAENVYVGKGKGDVRFPWLLQALYRHR